MNAARSINRRMTNPAIRRALKKNEVAETKAEAASYSGVIGKTAFFLLMTVIGIAAFFALHAFAAGMTGPLAKAISVSGDWYSISITMLEAIVFAGVGITTVVMCLLSIFVRSTVPVTGTIYCIGEGFLLTFLTQALSPELRWVGIAALVLTVALVLTLLFLYKSGVVRVNQKFRRVSAAVFISVILGGIVLLVMHFIPGLNVLAAQIDTMMANPVIAIIGSIVFLFIACLFLISDFDAVREAVDNRIDRKYEWMLAFGIAYTVLYIYLKILNILIRCFAKAKK